MYYSVKYFMYVIYVHNKVYVLHFAHGDALIPGDAVFFLNVFLFKFHDELEFEKCILCVRKHKLCTV